MLFEYRDFYSWAALTKALIDHAPKSQSTRVQEMLRTDGSSPLPEFMGNITCLPFSPVTRVEMIPRVEGYHRLDNEKNSQARMMWMELSRIEPLDSDCEKDDDKKLSSPNHGFIVEAWLTLSKLSFMNCINGRR